MITFKKPIEDKDISYESVSKNKGTYDVSQGINVFSPYNGVVEDVPSKCNGYLKIKHDVENETFYSNFCNLDKQKVTFGHRVSKGTKIGETGSEKLIFWITNNKDKKQSIEDAFKGTLVTSELNQKSSEQDKKPSDKDLEKEKKQKERKEKDNVKKEKNKEPKTSSPRSNVDFDKDSELLGLRFMAAPFTIVGNALKEEIERIKQLLK
jgi:hypothetical protein